MPLTPGKIYDSHGKTFLSVFHDEMVNLCLSSRNAFLVLSHISLTFPRTLSILSASTSSVCFGQDIPGMRGNHSTDGSIYCDHDNERQF